MPDALRELGADVRLQRLTAGDYLLAPGTVVERKTVADLHRSVATGRLWRQLQMLRGNANRAWLLVEGPRLDAGPLAAPGIRGAILAVVETGIPVLWSSSAHDTALWLMRLAARTSSGRSAWAVRAPRRHAPAAPTRLLCEVQGISPRLAARLLDRFGSIAAVACASQHELVSVDGIGEVRANALRDALSGTTREARSALA